MTPRRILLVLAFAGLGAAGPLAGQSVIVGVGGELTAPVATDFYAPIFADMRSSGGQRLGGYTVRVSWTPAVLQFLTYEAGVFAQPLIQTDSLGFGVAYFTAVSVPGRDGVVELFRIRFRALAATSSAVTVLVKELSAAVTFADLTSIAATVNSTFCGSTGRWGDLDGDSLSNSRDALAILSHVVGVTVAPQFILSRGDVNNDTKVNSVDALIILSYAVGLQIPGQRVLLPIPGACGSGPQVTMGLVPDTVDVVPGQRVRVKVVAATPSGSLVGLAVSWEVENPEFAVVDPTGLLVGRGEGTTRVVAALGPGIRFSSPVVVRARRSTWIVNAPVAKRAAVQMGTFKWPFSTPQRAFRLLSEGDTVRVLPGVHDYENPGEEDYDSEDFDEEVRVGFVMIGDTLPNGTRPVLRAPAYYFSYGIYWTDGQRGEVVNVELMNFYYPVYSEGLANLTLRNVKVNHSEAGSGYGIYLYQHIDTVRVINSEIGADTSYSSTDGLYISDGARVLQLLNSRFINWGGTGVRAYDVDSLDMQGNEFRNNNSNGIYVNTNSGAGYALDARVSRNKFLDNGNDGMELYGLGRAVLDHNFVRGSRGDGFWLDRSGQPGVAVVRSQADSILFPTTLSRTSVYVNNVDSILVDSLWIRSPADTAQSQSAYFYGNYVSVTRSQFLNLLSYGLQFRGRKLVVDQSAFNGCNAGGCGWNSGTAISARALNDSGPAVTLTNSTFSKLNYVIDAPLTNDSAGPFIVTNVRADSISRFVVAYADSMLMTNDTLTKVQYYGLFMQPSGTNKPPKTAVVMNNSISCLGASGTGIRIENSPGRIEHNLVTGCNTGIYANGTSLASIANLTVHHDSVAGPNGCCGYGINVAGRYRPTITANHVAGFYYGIYVNGTDSGTVKVDSNAVSGAGYIGLYLEGGGVSGATMTGQKNHIEGSTTYGIYNAYHTVGSRAFTNSWISGNGTGVYNSAPPTFDATGNWWGNAGGPGQGGANGVSANVTVTGFLTSPPADVPPVPAPPWLVGRP